MDKFIHLPVDVLKKLLDCFNSLQTSSNEVITNQIKSILKDALLNLTKKNSSPTATNNGLQETSHIYSFLLDCFVDLNLISSSQFDTISSQSSEIKLSTLLTKEILSKLHQNLKCCQESISIFQSFSFSKHDYDNDNLLNQLKEFFQKYPQFKNKFGVNGTTILYAATQYGNFEIIKYLIETVKCPLNLQNPNLILPDGKELLSNGNTSLHGACYFQHLDIVKYLLKHENIDVNLKNSLGQTPQMIAESNKNQLILQELKQFSKISEMFYIILNETTNLDEEIVTKFILKDSESIEEIIEENFCDVKNEKQSLVCISNIEQQQWITFAIYKVSKEVFVFFVNDESSSSYLSRSCASKKSEIRKIIEKKFKNNFSIEIIENKNREENDEISDNQGFALALYKMKIMIEFLKDEPIRKERFKEINFSTYNSDETNSKRREIIFNFEKLFIKKGLEESIGKETLEKILISLKTLMKNDEKYILEENQLEKLTELLTKKNFTRQHKNEVDLKEFIIKILLEFQYRGQIFNNPTIQKCLREYYEKNKTHLDKIEEFDKNLHENCRDNQIKGCLVIALNYQNELLFSIEKLIPTLKYFDEFIQLLDDHYQKKQELEIEKIKLNKKLKILNLQEENDDEFIHISFKISEIQKQLDYCLVKAEISRSIDVDDLIIIVGENITHEFKFSQGMINKIIEVGKRTDENEELALALIKIFEKIFLDKNRRRKEIENVFNKLLSKISHSEKNVTIIVNLRNEFLINLNQNSNLLKYLHEILIENSNSTNRRKALEILKLSKFYPNNLEYINQTVQLEEKAFQNDPTLLQDCLIQVKNRNKLTLNVFQKLTEYFPDHIEIIQEIVEQDIQKLPDFFIQKLQECIKSSLLASTSSNQTKTIIRLCKLLIKGKYSIKLDEIQSNIEDLLSTNEDKNLQDEVLEMIFTKFTNGDQIEKKILEKIKLLAIKNQYAENIIEFIEKKSISEDLSILKNSRNDLTQRKQALNNIMIPSMPTMNILKSLIRYDPYLRTDALKKLIDIMPNDFEINLNEIAEAIYNDEDIRIEDISKLVHKIKKGSDILPLLPAIFRWFHTDEHQHAVLNLLNEISCFEQQRQEEFVQYLLNLAVNTTENRIRSQLITIIKKCIENKKDLKNMEIKKQVVHDDETIIEIQSSLIDELNKLKMTLLVNKNTLEELSKSIEQRSMIVTEDQILLLIETLAHPYQQEQNIDHQIIDILLQIDLTQGLTNNIINCLCEKIIKNPELVEFPNLVRIINISLNKNRNIPNPVIEAFWKQFLLLSEDLSNETQNLLKYNLIYTIKILVTQKKQIPTDIFKKLANLLRNQQENIQMRIAIAKILSKQIEFISEQVVLQSLKDIALQSRNNQNEDLLTKIIFRSLKEHIDNDFLNIFYENFKTRILIIDKTIELQKVDEFIHQEQNQLKKFQLLNVLNIQLSDSQQIDTTILTRFTPDDWTKEILASQLITQIFKIKQNYDEGINEFELEKFRKYIHLLTKQNNYSIEDLLEIFIIKQNIYEFNLEILNDIFSMIISQESIDDEEKKKVLDILQNDYDDFYIQLQSIWLDKQLKSSQIEYTNESLIKLNQYLPYRPEIITLILERIYQSPKIVDELIEFFITLINSGLTQESQQSFLVNELSEKMTIKKLSIKLGDKLIGLILSDKFSFYQDYLKSKKNYKDYRLSTNIRLKKNAYNQAETTEWYTAEDIAQISFQWMKKLISKKLRITQALGQQDNMSLTTILNKIIDEYKQEKNTIFIIPLNIAGNHWVTIGLVPIENRNILLYKDSLGEENMIEEREKVEQIFAAAELPNFEFKYNRSCEQFDGYNCGIFALRNMKIMAKQLTSSNNENDFIENFEYYKKFVNQKEVVHLRKEKFPKMYALSLCESFKRRKIIDHHSSELKYLEELLRMHKITANNIEYSITTIEENFKEKNNQICLSIALLQEENLLENDYQYLYVIKISGRTNGFDEDFTELKEKLMKILDIHIHEIYEQDKNFMKILDRNLTKSIQKKQKLHPSQLTIDELSLGDKEIEQLLGQLDVQITEFNKEILRENLGLKKKNSVVISPIKNQNEIIDNKDCELLYTLHQKLTKILTCVDWLLQSIVELLSHVDSKLKLEHLLNSLDPIYEYNLKEYDQNMKGKSLFQILKTTSSEKWITEIHNLAIFQTFKGSHVKDLNELIQEIFPEELNKQFLLNEYENIERFYEEKPSEICPEFGIIKNWEGNMIIQWAEKLKLNRNSTSRHEMIAVIKRAVKIKSNFPPREIQLLSLIILLNPKEKHGRLTQINTGEGKTTIVAMLAAIKALEGRQVDIVTSSPELAKPQSEEQKEFFRLFDLTCEHNGQDSSIDIKQRYQANIVYGAASDFQGDILRDEYSKLGTRQGRQCDVAIVDEVDSMLIDGKNHIVMLSSSVPGMDNLEPLLAAIWIQIGEVAKSIKEINGKWYFINQENLLDENGKLRSDIVEHAYCIEETKEQFIKDCTEKHIRKLIRDKDNLSTNDKENLEKYPEIEIPKHLRELVIKTQLKKWISSAIHAKYKCKNNQDYIIKNGKIAPVDVRNTGIVQQNMNWNDGLHQFLQLKHGAKITPENFTTNFISNVTYFNRYSPNIFGLTGTLGSNNARELLNETYKVDSVIIPPFKQKQYKELASIICDQEDDWYMNIVETSMNKLKNGRGVLIITKYIQQVEEIRNRLIDAGCNIDKIKMYKTEEDSMKVIKQELKHGEIIIATNIAGRGTDIRASDTIENNGGLHVCVTFLPTNKRVEQQNVGRTSRTGNKGTGQFILLIKNFNNDFEKLKKIRDEEEEAALASAKKQIKKVVTKDEIFGLFCKLLDKIDDSNSLLQLSIQKSISKIKLRAVEERFGIWLKMEEAATYNIDEEQIKHDEMKKNFEIFEKQILQNKKSDELIQNPYFHILIGNEYLAMNKTDKYDQAIEEFTKAIELDEYFQVNAFYNRGYARIAQYGNDIQHEQITKAIDDLKQANKRIEENFEPLLSIIQQASTNSEALSEQVTHKMTLYGVQKNTIEMAIGQDITSQIKVLEKEKQEQKDAIERSRKEIDQQLENLEKEKTQIERINELKNEKKEQENIMVDKEKAIDEQIQKLKENQEAKELGIIGQARKSNRSIEIEHVEIEKSLPEDEDVRLYKEEIQEYKNNGFRGSFKIKEIKPIDWKSVISVAALGLAQLVGGAAIAVFSLGAGATIGMGLIFEGVSDLITAVKDGIINRDFSWVSYGIQKAISLTVSLVCAGMGAIKDAAKTAAAGIKQAASVMTKVATTAVTTVTKTGWRIAAKAMGTAIAKGVAKELVTQLADYGVNKALMPSIEEEIMKLIEKPIQDALMSSDHVQKMLKLDGIYRKKTYEMLIKNKALELLSLQQNGGNNALITIAEGIAKGIATNKIPGLSTIMQIAEAVEAIKTLKDFVPKFLEKLEQTIKDLFEKEGVQDILDEFDKKQQVINTKKTAANTEQKQNDKQRQEDEITGSNSIITTSNYNGRGEDDDDINTSQSDEQEQQVELQKANKSPDQLRQLLAASVSTNMCNIIKSKLITPVTRSGIDYGMRNLTAGLDKSIEDQMGDYRAERRIEFSQDGDLDNRIPDEFKKGMEDEESVKKANAMILELEKGGEAGLPHLGSLSEEIGRPIKVLDEKGRVIRIIGAHKGGAPVEVEYHNPTINNLQGHWTLPGGKEPTVNNTGENNCLFNVIAEQTGKDPNKLRAGTAVRMEGNKVSLANQASDIRRLEQYKKSALTMGGRVIEVPHFRSVLDPSNHPTDDRPDTVADEILYNLDMFPPEVGTVQRDNIDNPDRPPNFVGERYPSGKKFGSKKSNSPTVYKDKDSQLKDFFQTKFPGINVSNYKFYESDVYPDPSPANRGSERMVVTRDSSGTHWSFYTKNHYQDFYAKCDFFI